MLPDALDAILQTLRQVAGETGSVTLLRGGDINQAARVAVGDEYWFLKWNPAAPTGLFAAEAAGLEALRQTGSLRIPEVRMVSDAPAFLALEYLEERSPADIEGFTRRFAGELAALHQTSPAEGVCGYLEDNWLGLLPQKNSPRTTDWASFYRDCRLLPQIERARTKGLLAPRRESLLGKIVELLPRLLDGLPPDFSLLHGDLWSGNYLCLSGDTPALIDPAIYYGPREMELAFIELFGGFPPGFARAYQLVYPLDSGYAYRRSLHQLYPLLVHLNHFGETYGPAVEGVCRAYLPGVG